MSEVDRRTRRLLGLLALLAIAIAAWIILRPTF
jgi:hypothetical protein